MSNFKILYVASEINPFLKTSEVADFVRNLPQAMLEKGMEIRILVPRFGLINERKNRLHEVVRLSGINISIGDEEKPLVIKVASIPNAKLQVYFIDNEDYFKRKDLLVDKDDKLLKDNDERMIFFTKGVIETVKKLNWMPDIIHLHGWFASLFPLYLKKLFADDPVFDNSKIVSSVYSKSFGESLSKKIVEKIQFDGIEGDLDLIKNPNFESLTDLMIKFSDSVIISSDKIDKSTTDSIKSHSKDSLSYKDSSDDDKLMQFLLKNTD